MAEYHPADIPFYSGHLDHIGRGLKRDVRLFSALLDHLNIDVNSLPPILGVVGSKGKGTCVAAASQYLHYSGRQVVSVVSPHYIANRERLRINGKPVDKSIYSNLADQISQVLVSYPHLTESPTGYLSPVGRFLAAGCLLASHNEAEVMVVEAGMGGWSDEISNLVLSVLAVTSLQEEHLGQLGPSVEDVAWNKLYLGHSPSVEAVILGDLPPYCDGPIERLVESGSRVLRTPNLQLEQGADPFGPANAAVGYVAAGQLIESKLDDEQRAELAADLWQGLVLPARNQLVVRSERSYVVNSAATIDGVLSSVKRAERDLGGIDTLVLCIPDDKRPSLLYDELSGSNVIWTYCSRVKYQFTETSPQFGVEILNSPELGNRVFVSGVVPFAGEALDFLSVPETALSWW